VLPPPPVKEIPLPESLELEEGDEFFGDEDDIAGLLGTLPLDEPEDEEGAVAVDEDDEELPDIDEPSPEDLLSEDQEAEVLDIDEPEVTPEDTLPKGFVAEPDEE
jgi:hypothetical protein